VVTTLPSIGAQVIRLEPSAEIGAMSRALSALPPVEYVEPVFIYHAFVDPNDGQYGQQWAWPEISAPAGWDIQRDSQDVVVAVIDTGVDYNHEDLAGNMWRNPNEVPSNGIDDDGNGLVDDVHGANFVPTTPTGDPMDDNNHGTHVAGTIGAVTNNTTGVAGTSWKPQIMALKFLDANGSGSTVGAIKAVEYALAKGVDIMSNSWGGGGFSQALEDAIELANDQGILFTAAAGNSNSDNDTTPQYPSSYDIPNVLAVMATDRANNRAGFSNFGAQSVDVGAPGVEILSTVRNNQYRQFNGTSMATPHVSGVAALLKQQDATRDAAQLKQLIMANVDQLPALQGTSVTGGRINLARALGAEGAACPGGPAQVAYDEFFWPERRSSIRSATSFRCRSVCRSRCSSTSRSTVPPNGLREPGRPPS
jgi:subtilisin family serine protease